MALTHDDSVPERTSGNVLETAGLGRGLGEGQHATGMWRWRLDSAKRLQHTGLPLTGMKHSAQKPTLKKPRPEDENQELLSSVPNWDPHSTCTQTLALPSAECPFYLQPSLSCWGPQPSASVRTQHWACNHTLPWQTSLPLYWSYSARTPVVSIKHHSYHK